MGNTHPETILTEKKQVDNKDVSSAPAAVPKALTPAELECSVLEEQAITNKIAQDIGELSFDLKMRGNSERLLGAWIILESCFGKLLRLMYSIPRKTSLSGKNVSRAFKKLFKSTEVQHQAKKNAILAALEANKINPEVFVERLLQIFEETACFVQCYNTVYDDESSIEVLTYHASKLSSSDLLYIDILNQSI